MHAKELATVRAIDGAVQLLHGGLARRRRGCEERVALLSVALAVTILLELPVKDLVADNPRDDEAAEQPQRHEGLGEARETEEGSDRKEQEPEMHTRPPKAVWR